MNTDTKFKPAAQEFKDVMNSICKLESAFHVEMNAKNQAYYFILENGHFDSFRAFCKNKDSKDAHKSCIDFLVKKGEEMEPVKHKSKIKKGFIILDFETRDKIVLSMLKGAVISERIYKHLYSACNVLDPLAHDEQFEPSNIHDTIGETLALFDVTNDETIGDNNFYWYLIQMFNDVTEECAELNYENAAKEIFERWSYEIKEWEKNNRTFTHPNNK